MSMVFPGEEYALPGGARTEGQSVQAVIRPDEFWIRRLPSVAFKSDDPDTQTACIIVSSYGLGIAEAANRIPDGAEYSLERRRRPAKYTWIQHAESRAIAMLAGTTHSAARGTMYLNWFPCMTCAQLIVQAGITTLYTNKAQYECRAADPRYGFVDSMTLLTEAGVAIKWF